MDSSSVFNVLNKLPKNEKIYYRSNPGNAGDALIAAGAFILFEQAGLDIEIIDVNTFDSTGKIVIYAGGGNLVGIYPEARDFFFKHHKNAKQFILLPHTVAKNEDLLSQLGSNVTLFAREEVTYNHLLQHAKHTTVLLDHDLAFHIKPNTLLSEPIISLPGCIIKKVFYKLTDKKSLFSALPQPSIMWRNSVFEWRSFFSGNNSGNFFRTDVERALEITPEHNTDLSIMYEYGTRNKEICFYTVIRLLKFLNKHQEINTDRLHICIAGALLGKEVNFYPNSYFKCRAVFDYSLKNRFPCVNWCSAAKMESV
jgi:exopolysaccharide biosynthesis predicted pyruvyltransferase EpsI